MSLRTRGSYWTLLLFIGGCLAIGGAGSFATASSLQSWYSTIQKPPLNPPNWIFGPVWTTLYILMAIAGWRIWNARVQQGIKLWALFLAQLFFNTSWSFLFFGLRSPFLGLLDIACLWTSLLILVVFAWSKDRVAAALLTPYILWVSFASYLNSAIWWLNR